MTVPQQINIQNSSNIYKDNPTHPSHYKTCKAYIKYKIKVWLFVSILFLFISIFLFMTPTGKRKKKGGEGANVLAVIVIDM